jgi:hypothetical protein
MATASATRYHCTTAAVRATSAGLCCFGRVVRTSEASVPSRPWPLQPRDDARPRGAVASSGKEAAAGEDEWGARGRRRPRFLCLHGFRTSGEIMRLQVMGRWPAEVTSRVDLVFPDAPFPAGGASPVAGVFDPPYFEWCQFDGEVRLGPASLSQFHRRCIELISVSELINFVSTDLGWLNLDQDFLGWRNLDRCFSHVEELMVREGPFDGLLGFSQGAAMSAVLAGLQEQVRKKSSVCLSDRVSCYGCGFIW